MLSFSSIIPGTGESKTHVLPAEILPTIFKNMSGKERRNMQCVCKDWDDICNLRSLSSLDDDVIYCRGCYQLPDTYEFLSTIDRRDLNLKFNDVRFKSGSSFWKINGSRIRSISLENCQLDNEVLRDIVFHCEKLSHLAIRFTRSCRYTCPSFARISKNGIVRKNLQYLEICTHDRSFSEANLMQSFPELKVLKVPIFNSTQQIGPVVNDYLKTSSDKIVELAFDFQRRRLSSNEFNSLRQALTDMTRLSALTINCSSELFDEDLDSFICSKPLKSLEYDRRYCRLSLESFLERLLRSNPKMEHLKIISSDKSDKLVITRRLLEAMKSSDLKTVHLDINGRISIRDPDSVLSYLSAEPKTSSSPRLTICLSSISSSQENDMVSFLQCIPNLHHLQMYYMTPNILQALFTYQKQLKSLITFAQPWRSWQNQVEKYEGMSNPAFSQLPGIERLDLDDPTSYIFLRSLSPEPVLANLKYLKISLLPASDGARNFEWDSPADLLKLAHVTPFLEALYIKENLCLPFLHLCEKLCTKLTRLRFLYWGQFNSDKEHLIADEDYQKLFSIWGSLRALCHTQLGKTNKYFFDTLNKKVIPVVAERKFTFAEPVIGGLTVDWLKL